MTVAKRSVDKEAAWPKAPSGEVPIQTLLYLVRKPIYAGYIDLPKWNMSMIPAKHEPLVDHATFQRAQDRLAGRANVPIRKDVHRDFPLRGAIACHCCGNAMTAGWSKGRGRHYPYYTCQTKGCERRGKSVRKEQAETAFETPLRQLRPIPELFNVVKLMLNDMSEESATRAAAETNATKRELADTERKITKLVDRIVETDNEDRIATYENRLNALEKSRAVLKAKLESQDTQESRYSRISRTAFEILANPWKLWASDHFDHQ